MTEDEQWGQIDYPSFFGAIGAKITAAKKAMAAVPVSTHPNEGYLPWLETNVNNVPIRWREIDGNYCAIRVGEKADGTPINEFTIPTQWLAA